MVDVLVCGVMAPLLRRAGLSRQNAHSWADGPFACVIPASAAKPSEDLFSWLAARLNPPLSP